jgi:hypothetical protein
MYHPSYALEHFIVCLRAFHRRTTTKDIIHLSFILSTQKSAKTTKTNDLDGKRKQKHSLPSESRISPEPKTEKGATERRRGQCKAYMTHLDFPRFLLY